MTEKQYIQVDQNAIQHLKNRDARLGKEMERIGRIEREIIPDLFPALVNCIVGQQISNKAAATVWNRMQDRFGEITPPMICIQTEEEIQKCGLTWRKAGHIKNIATAFLQGEIQLERLYLLSDDAVIQTLVKLPGIGVWTAEMILIFCLQRPDILSWGDLAIRRAISVLYAETNLTKARFNDYKTLFRPYGSVASLYLWQIARENM
ncbi:MAG: DNA-3-methyladenine glycosylase family protein [Anaerolineaceae bacterium]